MHVPVMLRESLEYLGVKPDGIYLDATAGLGGHTGAIARQLTTGLVLACDRDAESLATGSLDAASALREGRLKLRGDASALVTMVNALRR